MTRREQIDRLIRWRIRHILPAADDIANALSVEGLPHEQTPPELAEAVRAFRGLRHDARFTHVRRVLEAIARGGGAG